MRIRLKANIFGAWHGKRGDEVNRPDAEAQKLIKAGYAGQVLMPAKTAEQLRTAILREPEIETPEEPTILIPADL